jgi:hypothetical protein
MNARDNTTLVGVGLAACAACCAGPMLGVLAAIGVGTAAGFLLVGLVAIAVGATAIAVVVWRRRRTSACGSCILDEVPVEVTVAPGRSNDPSPTTVG